MRTGWLIAALLLSALLAVSHIWAMADFLYWKYVWLDVPVHLLGGLAIGVFVAALLNAWKPLSFLLLAAVLIIGWEVFEYFLGPLREANYVFDTAIDLLMGTIGALIAYSVARFSLWRSA